MPMVLLLVLASLLLSPFGFAQTKPTAGQAVAKAAENTYADEAFVIEQLRNSYEFENDGTGQHEIYAKVRVQSEAGVKTWGQLVVGYNSANETIKIPFVRVLKQDGSTITAPPDAIQDLSSPIEREAPVYTDFRQKHVTVPGLRPGDILEYDVVRVVHTPLAAAQFWMEHDFDTQNMVVDELLEVSVPAARAIKLKTKPGVDAKITETAGRRKYEWRSKHLEKDDNTQTKGKKKKKANQAPSAPAVQLSSFQSWEEVGRWYGGLEKERRQPTPELKAKADELTKGLANDLAKTEALYDFVAKNFRYVSLSLGLGRYQPHSALDVLHNEYGDCKDKHTLLASLLEAEGIHASSVLIGSARKLDADVPSPAQFDHVITVAALNNEDVWMDTTTEVAPFRLLLPPLRDKDALEIPPGEAARIVKTPADPPMAGVQEMEVDGKVDEFGKLTANVHMQARGDLEVLLRMVFRRVPNSSWQQVLQSASAIWGLSGDVSEVNVSNPELTRAPFEIRYKLTDADYFDSSRKNFQILVPLSPVMTITPPDESDNASTEPIKLGARMHLSSRVKLQLPLQCVATIPAPMTLKRDYAEYSASYQVENGVFSAERIITIKTREIPRTRLQDYAAFQRAVAADLDQNLGIENSSAGSFSASADLSADDAAERGIAALNRQNYPVAIDLLKRAVAKDPKHKFAWNNLGQAYLSMRQYDEAIAAFQKQIEINAYDEFAYNNLGRVYWAQRKYDLAVGAFQKQLEINPLDKFAHGNLGDLYLELKKYDLAVPELEKAAAIQPDNALLQVSAGKAYLNLGQDDKAMAAFDKATNLSASPVVWNNIAYELSLKNSHLDKARQYAQSAVEATAAALRNVSLDQLNMRDVYQVNSIVAYWDTLGWVYFMQGDLVRAEKYVTAAWIVGQHADVGEHLGQIYQKNGQKDRAVQAYAEAMSSLRPPPELRGRLVALVGADKAPLAIEKHRLGLQNTRTIHLGKIPNHTGTAEFFLLLEPAGSQSTVTDAKYVSGDEQMKGLAESLKKVKYPLSFPDDISTKILRRGVASCSAATHDCLFVMEEPGDVRSLN